MITQQDIDSLEEVFVTKDDLKTSMTDLKSDIMDKMDEVLSEIKDSREEETVMAHQISGHEDRITKIEVALKTS